MAQLRTPLGPVNPLNTRCYIDFSTAGGEPGALGCVACETPYRAATLTRPPSPNPFLPAGRLLFELFVQGAPKAAEAFRVLCTTSEGPSWVCFPCASAGLHLVAPPGDSPNKFHEESGLPRDRAGLLCVEGGNKTVQVRPSSFVPSRPAAALLTTCFAWPQFVVTLGRHDDAACLVFGRLIRGYGLLKELSASTAKVCVTACGELAEGDDGVVIGPDGDPFSRWPQDYPGLADTTAVASFALRSAASETIRALGNEAYAAKKWQRAVEKYEKALRYLDMKFHRDAEHAQEEADARKAIAALSAPLHLNLAAVKLKLRDFRGVVEHCNTAEAIEREAAREAASMGQEPVVRPNVKVLFRRGVALARCREFAAAEADLLLALSLAPTDGAIAMELRLTRAAAAEHKVKTRTAFASAFACDE